MALTPAQQAQQQNRTPDGRYAEDPAPDPGQLDLPTEIDMWDPNGTFEFPPWPANAQHLVAFWSQVDIPDNILQTASYLYNQRRYDEMFDIGRRWRVKNPNSRLNLPVEEYDKRVANHIEQEMAERDKTYPKTMPTWWVRGIVRAAKMDEAADNLPPEEAALVRGLIVRLPGDYRATVQQLVDTYRTRQLLPNLLDLTRRDDITDIIERDIARHKSVF